MENVPMHTFGIKTEEIVPPYPIGILFLSPKNPNEEGIPGKWIEKTIIWEKIGEE